MFIHQDVYKQLKQSYDHQNVQTVPTSPLNAPSPMNKRSFTSLKTTDSRKASMFALVQEKDSYIALFKTAFESNETNNSSLIGESSRNYNFYKTSRYKKDQLPVLKHSQITSNTNQVCAKSLIVIDCNVNLSVRKWKIQEQLPIPTPEFPVQDYSPFEMKIDKAYTIIETTKQTNDKSYYHIAKKV